MQIKEIKMGKYRHFKGGMYELINIAEHTETGESLAIYRRLDGTYIANTKVWARPLNMFLDVVPEGKENPIGQNHRFEYQS